MHSIVYSPVQRRRRCRCLGSFKKIKSFFYFSVSLIWEWFFFLPDPVNEARDLRALVVGGEAVEAVVGGQGRAVLVQDAGLRGVDIFKRFESGELFLFIFFAKSSNFKNKMQVKKDSKQKQRQQHGQQLQHHQQQQQKWWWQWQKQQQQQLQQLQSPWQRHQQQQWPQ